MIETRRVEVDLVPGLVDMRAMEPCIVASLAKLREDLAARDTEAEVLAQVPKKSQDKASLVEFR